MGLEVVKIDILAQCKVSNRESEWFLSMLESMKVKQHLENGFSNSRWLSMTGCLNFEKEEKR